MNNLYRSVFVIVAIVLLVALLLYLIFSIILKKKHIVARGTIILLLIPLIAYFLPYTDYREKALELQLICVLTDQTDTSNRPLDTLEWFAIYDDFGLGTKSRFNQHTIPYVDWCDLDLENHSYIISFGREIKNVTYNIWDSESPALLDLGSSFKVGNAEFAEEIDTTKIYVYEIERVRVDHDIHNSDSKTS